MLMAYLVNVDSNLPKNMGNLVLLLSSINAYIILKQFKSLKIAGKNAFEFWVNKKIPWMQNLYKLKRKWALEYARDHFCARLTTT